MTKSSTPGSERINAAAAAELINKAIQTTTHAKSYHFIVKDDLGRETPIRYEGDFVYPDRQRVRVFSDGDDQSEMIMIGKDVYVKSPGSDVYAPVPGTNMVGGFDSLHLLAMSADTIGNITVIGDETLEGVGTTHLAFTFVVAEIPEPYSKMRQDAWIDKRTNYIRALKTFSTETQKNVVVTFSEFNESVTPPIEIP